MKVTDGAVHLAFDDIDCFSADADGLHISCDPEQLLELLQKAIAEQQGDLQENSPHSRLERLLFSSQKAPFSATEHALLHCLVESPDGSISIKEAEDVIFKRTLTKGRRDGIRRRINGKLEPFGLAVSISDTRISIKNF